MADVKFKDRKHFFLLYPDNPAHKNAIEHLLSPEYRAVGICHDKDTWTEEDIAEEVAENGCCEHKVGELKKPHWHIVVKFKNNVWNTSLANDLGIETRFMRKIPNFNEAALYLLHLNAPDKYQYDIEECRGALVPELKKLVADESEDCRILRILDLLDKQPYISMTDFIRLACKEGLYSDVRRAGYLMSKLWEEHNTSFGEVELPKPRRMLEQNGEVIE